MSDAELLMDTADRLLAHVVTGTRGVWPRAVAFAVRGALELELDAYWQRMQPEVANVPMRSQLLLLRSYAGADVAADAVEAWHALSRACHHHAYELAPTAQELRRWLQQVRSVSQALARERSRPAGAAAT